MTMGAFSATSFSPVAFSEDAAPATPPAGPTVITFDPKLATTTPTIDLVALALSRLPHQYRGTNG